MNSKIGRFVSYVIAGGTGMSGVAVETSAKIAESTDEIMIPMHTLFGFPLSEIAIIVGIMGTITTMTLQFLNWRDMHNKHKHEREAAKPKPETQPTEAVEENNE